MAKKDDLRNDKIRDMSDEEIGGTIRKLRDQIYRLRSATVTDTVEDTSQFGTLRRNVARLCTEQTRRQDEAAGA
ncbi:MAG: 50S ribosomal protein L29 [Planctomycetota bacterium]